jgi:hypothetical protein
VINFDKVGDGQSKVKQGLPGREASDGAGHRSPTVPTSLWADKYSRLIGLKNAELNRQIAELEPYVTHRKQTSAICSNRQKMRNCPPPIFAPSCRNFELTREPQR